MLNTQEITEHQDIWPLTIGIDYGSFVYRRLEDKTTEEGDLPPDSLRISDDGRQLYFNLYVGAFSDHIRVLVDESDRP